jgi:cytochrome c5
MRICFSAFITIAGMAVLAAALADGQSSNNPTGRAVYEANCANCHSGGFGGFFTGAPKVGNKEAWEALIPKGIETLTANTIKGVGKMAARGECETCSDEEIRAAIEYMVAESR